MRFCNYALQKKFFFRKLEFELKKKLYKKIHTDHPITNYPLRKEENFLFLRINEVINSHLISENNYNYIPLATMMSLIIQIPSTKVIPKIKAYPMQ